MRRVLLLGLALVLMAGLGWADGEKIGYTPPLFLSSGSGFLAPGTIELASGSNLYLYNTADRTTNYERGGLKWNGNNLELFTEKGGAGNPRNILITGNTADLYIAAHVYPMTPTDTRILGAGNMLWQALFLSRSIQGGKSKSLTDAAAATAYATIAVPTNGQIAGELIWTAVSSAAAVRFVANGSVRFWGTDEGGTPVCGINKIGTDGEGHSSGAATLVCTWTNVVATTNCALSVTCTNSTAGSDPITLTGRFNMPTTATIVFN